MRTASKVQGILACQSPVSTAVCQSQVSTTVCRSHVSTAVCMPTDPRAVIAPQAPYDVKYSRLVDHTRQFTSSEGDHSRAVTLQMVTKREQAPSKHKPKPKPRRTNTSTAATVVTPSVTSNNNQFFQVVVMRVSLHCQGCAGKVRKHISKMEGVSSFSVDLESKRVTVMGHVSPAGVLKSISKVKKAEFWTC